MDQQEQLKQLQNLFTTAQDILIITKEYPSLDGLCASLGLYGCLQGQRTVQGKEKNVVVAVSGRQGSQYTLLPFSNKIVSELGLRDFVIGINGYIENSIQNVSWYADKGRLNVVFKANPAVPMQLDLRSLDPFYAGANFNVVVVIDTATPADLGNAYRQDPGMYSELPVVNISTHPQNTRFGKINIVDPQVPAVCELVYQLTQVLRYSVNADVATLFKLGILDATQNLQKKGQQTESILAQLDSYHARTLDLNAVRQQGMNPPIAPIQQVSAPPPYPPYAAYPPQGFQYPPMSYGAPPYQVYSPPSAYPQFPTGYYSPYPSPHQVQASSYAPVSQFNQPYQQPSDPTASSASGTAQSNGFYDTTQQQQYGSSYEVPSLTHDMHHPNEYIPTSAITDHGHVEPAVMLPNVDYTNYYPSYIAESQDQQTSSQTSPSYSDFSYEDQSTDPHRGR